MEASQYALVHGMRRTRGALEEWNRDPVPVLGRWAAGSAAASCVLLLAVWGIATLASPGALVALRRPPLAVGDSVDVLRIFGHNLLVLALHAMACVAGFIAGSSLPLQAERHHGISKLVHEHGGKLAIAFVACATTFSLSVQAYVLGSSVSTVSAALRCSPGLLLLALLPHALLELTALFLPLAAWLIASRRGEWERLLAASLVTTAIALPVLLLAANWEVFVAPHIVTALIGLPTS